MQPKITNTFTIVGNLNIFFLYISFWEKSLLFWSDVSTDVIKMSYMNGTGVKTVIKWGLESPGKSEILWKMAHSMAHS